MELARESMLKIPVLFVKGLPLSRADDDQRDTGTLGSNSRLS